MTSSAFRFCDEFGPKRILHIYEPGANLRAIVVVDNVAAGPSIGGVRLAPDVSVEECFRLARAMTFKNAAAGLPHGGGKAVIFGDSGAAPDQKERWLRSFACAIQAVEDFIPGPDMGTNETSMAWIKDEIGRAVGLPLELGGIPLDEIGATGFGLVVAALVVKDFSQIEFDGARIAVQGFGAVGKHAAMGFAEEGSILVAAADSSGTVYDPGGLDIAALVALKERGGRLADYTDAEQLPRDAVVELDCDVLIPAARPDAVHAGNVDKVKAKLIIQGANLGVSEEAEKTLHQRNVICIPDFISNAGGVICAAVEYHGGTHVQAFASIEDKVSANTAEVLERAAAEQVLPRQAAVAMASERVHRAMTLRRWA